MRQRKKDKFTAMRSQQVVDASRVSTSTKSEFGWSSDTTAESPAETVETSDTMMTTPSVSSLSDSGAHMELLSNELGLNQWHSSIGSALHGTGMCKPCSLFCKPEGCVDGKDCLYCHSCDLAELKKRKTDQLKVVKLTRSADVAMKSCPLSRFRTREVKFCLDNRGHVA